MNKMISRTLLAVGLSLAANGALAGSERLARQYVEMLKYSAQYDEMHAQCLKSNSSIPPEKMLNIAPGETGPAVPGAPLWPKVVAAYEQYWIDICARPTRDEYLGLFVKSYAASLRDDELEESIRFLSTPVGAKVVEANMVAARAVYSEWQRLNGESVQPAVAGLQGRLQAIALEAAQMRCRDRSTEVLASARDCPLAKAAKPG